MTIYHLQTVNYLQTITQQEIFIQSDYSEWNIAAKRSPARRMYIILFAYLHIRHYFTVNLLPEPWWYPERVPWNIYFSVDPAQCAVKIQCKKPEILSTKIKFIPYWSHFRGKGEQHRIEGHLFYTIVHLLRTSFEVVVFLSTDKSTSNESECFLGESFYRTRKGFCIG